MAPLAVKIMKGMLEESKNLTFVEPVVKIKSALNDENREQIEAMNR